MIYVYSLIAWAAFSLLAGYVVSTIIRTGKELEADYNKGEDDGDLR